MSAPAARWSYPLAQVRKRWCSAISVDLPLDGRNPIASDHAAGRLPVIVHRTVNCGELGAVHLDAAHARRASHPGHFIREKRAELLAERPTATSCASDNHNGVLARCRGRLPPRAPDHPVRTNPVSRQLSRIHRTNIAPPIRFATSAAPARYPSSAKPYGHRWCGRS